MNTKAVIFDLDGTLLDSMHVWKKRFPTRYRRPVIDWDYIEEAYKSEVVLKPGAFDFLTKLRAHNIKMAFATVTDRNLIEPALHRNNIYDFFEAEASFTCNEVGENKESPLIYNKALECLEVNKKDVWVFEDADYAIYTAAMAGFKVAAVQDKWTSLKRHIKVLAELYIEDYTKLELSQLG